MHKKSMGRRTFTLSLVVLFALFTVSPSLWSDQSASNPNPDPAVPDTAAADAGAAGVGPGAAGAGLGGAAGISTMTIIGLGGLALIGIIAVAASDDDDTTTTTSHH